jgi:hypothetical protein
MITVKPLQPGAKALKNFNPALHQRAWERTRDMAINKAQEEVRAITAGWSAPAPAAQVQTTTWGATITVADKRWGFLDAGTKRHIIRPKVKKVLRFTAGGATVFARQVVHQANKALAYTKRVQQAVDRLNLASAFANIVQELTR